MQLPISSYITASLSQRSFLAHHTTILTRLEFAASSSAFGAADNEYQQVEYVTRAIADDMVCRYATMSFSLDMRWYRINAIG